MVIKTGIPKLDDLLKGGIKKKSNILFYSTPGVDNLPFAFQFLYNRLEQGDNILYFVNNKKPDAVRFMLKNYGWDISDYEKKGKFRFLDSYSSIIRKKSSENFFIKEVSDIDSIKKIISESLVDLKDKNILLIFDSLSNMIDICNMQKDIIKNLQKCTDYMKDKAITSVFLFTEWAYDKSLLDDLRTFFDCVIDLKSIERKVILRNYFNVSKADWLDNIEEKGIPFKITKPGGIKIYLPKILVTGPFNAGKTSFIHSASETAVSVDRFGTTIALDHGHVDFKGFSVDLWGTPGQERFDPIMELLGSESLGVIVVVDSTDPSGFSRAKQMLEITKTEGLPSVIAANKSNLADALNPDKIREIMNISKDIPIIPVFADESAERSSPIKEKRPCRLKKEDTEKVLSDLFEMVI